MKRKREHASSASTGDRHRQTLYMLGWLVPEETEEFRNGWDQFLKHEYPKTQREWRRILRR